MPEKYRYSITTDQGILLGEWQITIDSAFLEEEYEKTDGDNLLLTYRELGDPRMLNSWIHQEIGENVVHEIKTHLKKLEKEGV